MRQTTISNCTITYPENIVYLYDNNIITIQSNNSNFDTKITITSPNSSVSNLQYKTKSSLISFILDDNLKYLFYKTNGDWIIDIVIDDINIFSFSFKLLQGKSFLNKTHGSSSVIYNYSGDDLEIFSPNGGKIVCGNESIDVNAGYNSISLTDLGITNVGEYQLELTNKTLYQPISIVLNDIAISPTSSTIVWQTTEEEPTIIDGGSLWDRRQIFPQTLTLYYGYQCNSDVILRYINCDGCYREIAGKLLQEEDTFSPTKLNNVISGGGYKYNPNFVNNNNSKILKIGISDIDSNAELGDIIFSGKLQILDINNNWTDCMLKTNSIKNYKNGGFDNLELDIIISEL